MQDVGIKALAIHGRTRCQLYKGFANWEPIARVKNNPRIQIPIFGNGDIDSPEKALEYKNRYGVDGVMNDVGVVDIHISINSLIYSSYSGYRGGGGSVGVYTLKEGTRVYGL